MQTEELVDKLTMAMIAFDHGDPKRIQHFLKVHRFAQLIGRMEGLDGHTQMILECAAVVHDIGIHPSEEKYASSSGKYQELEGPAYAAPMLKELGVGTADIERICFLVGHHHTYHGIEGDDYRILVEADFLVNLYEDGADREAVRQAYAYIFKTAGARRICEEMFGF